MRGGGGGGDGIQLMGGGESEKEDDWPASIIAGDRLVDSPILFFVASHKAFRAELASLRRVAVEAAESGAVDGELVVDLSRRLEFLKLVCDYHSVAEDEVIFLALDSQVKNVVQTYSLEHKSIDDNFRTIFHHLDLLIKEDGDVPQMFQELIFSLGTVQSMVCEHMQKEEEQIFPLLKNKFSSEEQSQLVWRYMCSVPVILLEEFFPWMTHYLTSDEIQDVLRCIKLIIPGERLLQQVVVSWIEHEEKNSSHADHTHGKGYLFLSSLSNFTDIDKLYPPQIHCGREQQCMEACLVEPSGVEAPFKGIDLWHTALQRNFNQIIEELYEIRSSNCFSSLSSVLLHLKFVADVLIFYSNTLDKIIHPLLNILATNSPPCSPLIDECQIKGLQRLLFFESQSSAESFVEMLCQDLESLVRRLGKSLLFLEAEIFPSISESCTREMQLWLLYTSLHMMPLGLLKSTVTWFSAHLTENQSNTILKNMKLGCLSINSSLASVLHEWIRVGCSGKTSNEKFRLNLAEMFTGRSSYFVKQNRQQMVFSGPLLKQNSTIEISKSVDTPSSSTSMTSEEHDISSPSWMNLHILFSQLFKGMPSLHKNPEEPNHVTSPNLESRPMDVVFYVHRAIMKDLECLVTLSAKMAVNVEFLAEFRKCFKLLHNIYEIHSNAEDEIIFPALESKGALENISHSYCIDHKLESKYFRRTSNILNEISKLHDHEGGNLARLKRHQLCLKLHETCLSMHKVLCDHMHREEVELFPLFQRCFSIEEEEKVLAHMLGRTSAEILQQMIPWLMAHLSYDEQHAFLSLWLQVARNTKFDEWLREWWEGMQRYYTSPAEEKSSHPSLAADPLEVVSMYLLKDQSQKVAHYGGEQNEFSIGEFGQCSFCDAEESVLASGGQHVYQSSDLNNYQSKVEKKKNNVVKERCHDEAELHKRKCQTLSNQEHPLSMSQEELEAAIRRVSRDSNLDIEKKSYIIQNLLMSRWVITQKMSHEACATNHKGEIPGQNPSYRDPLKSTFGCKHYKRSCKLLAPCCNKLYTCIRCHDDISDHPVDRKAITKMMCMKCLVIQPIGSKCTSQSCNGFSMARYYCSICKLFDDDRQIYHCPYCNLCRLGKGLGIDYFHCMKCNACMSRSLFVHVCREKCLEDNCPICHEYIFTSNSPVKALPCGHLMHSSCFQVYTCSHYVCPICSKSLGDMQVYFGMLDALLAEETIPEDYFGKTQAILCNDCEKRGTASFHWLYHKCPYCGSYNTRLL